MGEMMIAGKADSRDLQDPDWFEPTRKTPSEETK